jgi:hypothetical protein
VGFSNGAWRDVLAGKPVAENVDTADGQEVSVTGAIRVEGSPERLVALIRDIDDFEREMDIDEVGLFGATPQLADLAGLTILDQDFGDIRNCRIGDCQLQFSAATLERFARDVDWNAADARAQATAIYHEAVFDALQTYRRGGLAGLAPYADRDPPTGIAAEMDRIYYPSDTPVPVPPLIEYLKRYPGPRPAGAEDIFYWNTGDFGMKPTTRLNHIVIYPVPGPDAARTGARFAIATRQVYANHYFSSTLELRTLIDDDAGDTPGFFLIYATRSRVPGLSGFMGAILRPIIKRRARSGMEKYLERTQMAIADCSSC